MLTVTSGLLAGIVVAGLLGMVSWTNVAIWIAPLIAFHVGVGLWFRNRVNGMLSWLRPVSVETRVLREGLQLMEATQFRSAKLLELAEQVRNGSGAIRKLERMLDALDQRDKRLVLLSLARSGGRYAIVHGNRAMAKGARRFTQAVAGGMGGI
jgi:hypothetical protein